MCVPSGIESTKIQKYFKREYSLPTWHMHINSPPTNSGVSNPLFRRLNGGFQYFLAVQQIAANDPVRPFLADQTLQINVWL